MVPGFGHPSVARLEICDGKIGDSRPKDWRFATARLEIRRHEIREFGRGDVVSAVQPPRLRDAGDLRLPLERVQVVCRNLIVNVTEKLRFHADWDHVCENRRP